MLRRLIASLAVLPTLAAPASAAARAVDVPAVFGKHVAQAAQGSGLPVLLPDAMPVPYDGRLYTSGTSFSGSYSLLLAAGKGCNGASVCALASFAGQDHGQPKGPREVSLAGGRTGAFTPTRCGANCSPPRIQWRQAGDLYTIAAKVAGNERRILRRLANQAIRGGDRSA